MLTFGMYFTNIGKRFGYSNYGLLAGLGLLLTAIISLVQFPLIALAANGKARQVNTACGAALLAASPYFIWLRWKERRYRAPVDEELEMEQEEENDTGAADRNAEDGDAVENIGANRQQEGEIPRGMERRMTFMGSFLRKPSYFGL